MRKRSNVPTAITMLVLGLALSALAAVAAVPIVLQKQQALPELDVTEEPGLVLDDLYELGRHRGVRISSRPTAFEEIERWDQNVSLIHRVLQYGPRPVREKIKDGADWAVMDLVWLMSRDPVLMADKCASAYSEAQVYLLEMTDRLTMVSDNAASLMRHSMTEESAIYFFRRWAHHLACADEQKYRRSKERIDAASAVWYYEFANWTEDSDRLKAEIELERLQQDEAQAQPLLSQVQ